MAQRTTDNRRHCWKAEGVTWVFSETGLYVASKYAHRWELQRVSKNPTEGYDRGGWYLFSSTDVQKRFCGSTMGPAVDAASAAVTAWHKAQGKGARERVA